MSKDKVNVADVVAEAEELIEALRGLAEHDSVVDLESDTQTISDLLAAVKQLQGESDGIIAELRKHNAGLLASCTELEKQPPCHCGECQAARIDGSANKPEYGESVEMAIVCLRESIRGNIYRLAEGGDPPTLAELEQLISDADEILANNCRSNQEGGR